MTLLNALADVAGIRVGHHTAIGDGYQTGTTVVLAPPGGMTAGVDVRGGGPGTRETDLLSPLATVEKVHALVLSGGSAYGLSAASGVAEALGQQGIGIAVGARADEVVPIVPAAVVFDLGRGGRFGARPTAEFGALAVTAAQENSPTQMAAQGSIGAGTGSCTGRFKGGIGQASAVLPNGTIISALVVANATGIPFDPKSGALLGASLMRPEDGPTPSTPTEGDAAALRAVAAQIGVGLADASAAVTAAAAESISHTTLGVVATDATLTKAQCAKMAGMAHDGLARAVNPVHTMFDGDLFFGAATGERPAPDPGELYHLFAAAGDVVTRAMMRAMLAAETTTTEAGCWPSYADTAPSIFTS
ncbi:peptidase S58 family protein [Nakamurella antarctica]|uniref:Peptidase S58 family protein n=1 Tax=Nakamurella antarctica TaxID=1902245 RepID=A0A3G8ZLJ7_9ACTN|nr:P1 family peptidase [Nakamurella antarctica]AZI58028.1 peptidase S58 family protein [Nakamurella antarctica]